MLGVFDENLDLIARELELVTRVDGTKITLDGEDVNSSLGAEVLGNLLKIAESGEHIDKSSLLYCIALAR